MQGDGNLVIYCDGRNVNWDSRTWNKKVRNGLVFQNDGNLVLYGPNGEVHWSNYVHGRGGQQLIMQNDGNLVLYTDVISVETAVWSTRTAGKCGRK